MTKEKQSKVTHLVVKNTPSPLAGEGEERSDGGVGFPHNDVCDYTNSKCEWSLTMGKYEPRPCGCNTRKLVNNCNPLQIGRGRSIEFPLLVESVRDRYNDECYYAKSNVESGLPPHLTHFKKTAFTLAEVLVTLGVIGIVAAMTIPTVMNKYQQKVAETRLAKFYSVMNNAIALSEIDNGDKKYWRFENKCSYSDNYTKECLVPIFEQYFKPYLKITGYEYDPNYFNPNPSNQQGGLLVNFADGSTAAFTSSVRNVFIYPVGSHVKDKNHQTSGKDVFGFNFYVSNCAGERCKYLLGKGFEPRIPYEWDGTEENLPCLKKAQLNGWKFPDDCNPFK